MGYKDYILSPFSFLWEKIQHWRRLLYSRNVLNRARWGVPVISVGNLTFGGTGKTPMVCWLVDQLEQQGRSCMVLTRGHKGDLEHGSGFLPGGRKFSSPQTFYGDEPLLIARKMKKGGVVVGKKRARNFLYFFDRVNTDTVILDDGHQHLQIDRQLNIVLFDSLAPIKDYRVAPLGKLREGLRALTDADVVLFTRCDQVETSQWEKLQYLLSPHIRPGAIMGKIKFSPQGLLNGNHELIYGNDEVAGKRILAVAALGSPQSFFGQLEKLGAVLVEKKIFPDHYRFRPQDIKEILQKARKQKALVVVSEKDMMKVRGLIFHENILYLGIKVSFDEGEESLKEKLRETMAASMPVL